MSVAPRCSESLTEELKGRRSCPLPRRQGPDDRCRPPEQSIHRVLSAPLGSGIPALRGNPEVVLERLEEIKVLGINHIFGSFGFPGLARQKAIRSIEMFASDAMPRFSQALAVVSGPAELHQRLSAL